MQIRFDTRGNEKQKQCVKYWVDDETIDIAYGGSKGCFAKGTLVKTNLGYIPIEEIKVGDIVLSLNEITKKLEFKEVENTFVYGGSKLEKMIIFVLDNNTIIKSTHDHKFYIDGNWQSAERLAERTLELCSKHKRTLFNIYKREINDEKMEKHNIECSRYNETCKLSRLFKYYNNSKWKEKKRKYSQISSTNIYSESTEQTSSKPYRFHSFKQLFRKFGMDNRERKFNSFFESKSIKRFSKRMQTNQSIKRRKGLEFSFNRKKGIGNKKKIQTKNLYERYASYRIWSEIKYYKRRCSSQELESHIIDLSKIKQIYFEMSSEYVYDIQVKDNHNFLVSKNEIIVHNSAKSYTGCSLIFGDALMYPGTRYFIARKKLTDLRKHTIPSIYEVFDNWGLKFDDYVKFNGQDNTFNFTNGSSVLFLDAKYIPSDPEYTRFGSMQMTRGWIEESGEFEPECKSNLQASVGRWKNGDYNLKAKLLQTCNPSKNYLYKDYYLLSKEGKLPPERKFIQALPTDNKAMMAKNPEYISNLLKILSPNEIQRLVYGNWEYDDNPNALFDYEDILALYTNEFVEATNEKYITADIAYTGSDNFVIFVWFGLVVKEIISIDKIDETQVSKKIHEIRLKYKVPIKNVIYDAGGLKMFVRESAKSGHLAGATQFFNNSRPKLIKGQIENFTNLKTQCAFKLSELVKNNEIYIQCPEYRKQIIDDFQQILKLPVTDEGKVGLEKKEDARKRLGRSYDYWDNCNMRMLPLINKGIFKDKSFLSAFV